MKYLTICDVIKFMPIYLFRVKYNILPVGIEISIYKNIGNWPLQQWKVGKEQSNNQNVFGFLWVVHVVSKSLLV